MNLINRTAVKSLALAASADSRGGKFTRVSKDFLDRIETKVRILTVNEVRAHPSCGVTLR